MIEVKSKFNGSKLELPFQKQFYSKEILDFYDQFNCNPFKDNIECPAEFKDFTKIILKAFNSNSKIIIQENIFKRIDLSNIKNNKVLLGFSCGLDSTAQAIYLKETGYDVSLFYLKNVNTYENGQANKMALPIAQKLDLDLIEASIVKNMRHENEYKQRWPENAMKNQMILACMIDWCIQNNCNKISLGDDFDLSIKDAVPGINLTDAREMTISFLDSIGKICKGIQFLKIDSKKHNKLDRIQILQNYGLQDLYYSCVLPGKFNRMRHESNQNKYNVKLFEKNCGSSCRKCAMHNLLLHYGNQKKFPEEFIQACWRRMYDNAHSADYSFFSPDLSLEQRIKNLFEY